MRKNTFISAVFAAFLMLGAIAFAQDNPVSPTSEAPADVTMEAASAEEGGESGEAMKGVSIFERIGQGGITMLFLAALSVGGLTFTLERGFNLRKRAINPDGLLEDVKRKWNAEDYDGILEACKKKPSALAHVVRYLIEHRTCSTLELSAISADIAGREMRGHLQKAYPLAIIATISPLLGLFGTVLGMIDSFELVAIAGSLGDASLLAGGISKALVTTAGGLALAIPSLGIYHFFKSRTSTYAMGLEQDVNELLTSWFMEKAHATESMSPSTGA